MKPIPTRRLKRALVVLLAVAGAGSSLLPARAQTGPSRPPGPPPPSLPAGEPAPLRYQRNVPGDSQPILLDADEVVTWTQKGQRLILLQGRVLVQQATVRVRCGAAVAFINLDRLQRTGILHADLFAEQDVRLEDGTSNRKGTRGLVDLNTRGELRIVSHSKKVLQQPQPDAPLFRRAVAELTGEGAPRPLGPAPGQEESSERPPAGLGRPRPPPPPSGLPMLGPPAPVELPRVPQEPGAQSQPGTPPAPSPPVSAPAPAAPPVQQSGPVRQPASGIVQAQYVPAAPGGAPAPPEPPEPPEPGAPSPPGAPRTGPRLLPPVSGNDSPLRQYSVLPRTPTGYQFRSEVLPTGEQATIFTGGVIISVRNPDGTVLIDIEADNAVVWNRGGLTEEMVNNIRSPEGQASRQLEFYLSGEVQVRQQSAEGARLLSADEMYLDANRHVAIASKATLEMRRKGLDQPVILRAEELRELSETKFQVLRAEVFSSKLPSDPGLKVVFTDATLEELRVPRRSWFGFGNPIIDPRTGQPVTEIQRPIDGRNARLELEDIPFFYVPWFRTDANDPLGPLQGVRVGGNRIFGAEFGATFDVYDLLHLQRTPFTRWRATVDYLSRRGPALGTQYDFVQTKFFDTPAQVAGLVKAYGMIDNGTDILGGGRGENDDHPEQRGRFLYRENFQGLPDGFSVQAQLSLLSDRNFLEQYFKQEFDQDINQETFIYLKQQQGNWAYTALVEPRLRNWVTEAEALPSVDGYLLGVSPLDIFTYFAEANAGYFQLREGPKPLVSSTDRADNTARFDFFQDLSLPFYAGPVKLAPYALLDLTYYTQDEFGEGLGRVWGGGGVRASMPLTRLYPDVHSLLWNLDGINHKIVLSADYRYVGSTENFRRFPQLDRLNDDATNQALSDIRPQQATLNPGNAFFLNFSPVFDPQVYAIRRMIDSRIDTRDDIQVVQLDIRQRLQTKRGFPGREHIVDWMILELSASVFPAPNHDNFGRTFSFLEYDYTWNIGDRTAFVSTGFFEPFNHGPAEYTAGAYLNRTDKTNFYLGYRQIDPLESKAVTAAASYVFSPKYAMTVSSSYDFGTNLALSNTFIVTRMGTDVNVGLGFTYNAIQKNFGVLFEIVPNLASANRRITSPTALGGLVSGGGLR
ncbi:MAG TPA: hypothetical protein VKD72_11785 [Gemmataceae bacterium]|nr:hypothetical protein [Gemmataceae bacterium]